MTGLLRRPDATCVVLSKPKLHPRQSIVERMLFMLDIRTMNINAVNLNVLVALDALLEERSVTRAARRVGVTQPAMSNTLAHLRTLLDDPLFRRTSHGLEPTPRALALAEPVRQGLRLFESALSAPSFDPNTAERTFVVAASDYV